MAAGQTSAGSQSETQELLHNLFMEGGEESMTSYILGGGITGLAAGLSSGLPVLEAAPEPGGICSSYYVRPGSD